MGYEGLLNQAYQQGLFVYETRLKSGAKGLIINNIVGIEKSIKTSVEKACALSEEMGHFYTSTGNILDQSILCNRKQEYRARSWGYEYLVPLHRILEAGQAGIAGRYEVSEYLEVTEDFLQNTIDHYQRKYGLFTCLDNYMIYFEPLSITKL